MRNEELGVRSLKCGEWRVECIIRNAEFGIGAVEKFFCVGLFARKPFLLLGEFCTVLTAKVKPFL